MITKEFDKDLVTKAKTYIKSYSKIEDSIVSVPDFLNYIENLDEDLLSYLKLTHLLQNKTHLRQMKILKKRKKLLELKVMILSGCISKTWVM